MVVQSYQKEFTDKTEKDFARLPESIQTTIMGYVSKGFWFEGVMNEKKHFFLVKMSQYHFIPKKDGKASKKGWVHEGIYKLYKNDGRACLARVTTIMPDGKEIYRSILDLSSI